MIYGRIELYISRSTKWFKLSHFYFAGKQSSSIEKNRFQQAPHLRLSSGLSGLIWQICFIYNLLLTEILIRDRKKNTQNKYIQSINILADVHKTMKTTTSDGRKKVILSYFFAEKSPHIYIEQREMSNTWLQLLSFCFVANSKNNKQIAYIVAARKMTHAFPYKIRIFSFSSLTEYDPLFPKCASWIVVRVKNILLHVLGYRQEPEDAWWKLLKSWGSIFVVNWQVMGKNYF